MQNKERRILSLSPIFVQEQFKFTFWRLIDITAMAIEIYHQRIDGVHQACFANDPSSGPRGSNYPGRALPRPIADCEKQTLPAPSRTRGEGKIRLKNRPKYQRCHERVAIYTMDGLSIG